MARKSAANVEKRPEADGFSDSALRTTVLR
jgi:hypothetical protein